MELWMIGFVLIGLYLNFILKNTYSDILNQHSSIPVFQ